MIMFEVLKNVNELATKLLFLETKEYRTTDGREWVDERSYNVVSGMFAIAKSLDNVAAAVRLLDPKRQSDTYERDRG